MFIFQKNFNNNGKTFDPIAFYNQQQARAAVHKSMQAGAKSNPTSTGAQEQTPPVVEHTPQMGDKDYDWKANGISGENSLWNKAHKEARRNSAGLVLGEDGVDRVAPTLPVTPEKNDMYSRTRRLAAEQAAAKQNQGAGTSSSAAFDETTIRKQLETQYHGHPQAQEKIEEELANAKAQHDAEFVKNQTAKITNTGAGIPTGKKAEDPKKTIPTKLVHPEGDIPIIDETIEEEITPEVEQFKADRIREAEEAKKSAAELRANTGLVRGKAQEHLDNARAKVDTLKGKAVDTWNKWSENYGEGLTGSLGKDAALAAGGLALAGGAYHLLKKRRAKKKAAKAALENKVKK
jgi:hypothetical protein